MENIFKEKSRLFNPIMLVSFIPILLIMFYLLSKGVKEHNTGDIIAASCAIFVMITVWLLLISLNLNVTIDNTGITFNFPPLKRKTSTYNWSEIESAELIKISALKNFGGWGIRVSRKYGKGYLSKGDNILFLILKDGKKISLTVIDPLTAMKFIPKEKLVG